MTDIVLNRDRAARKRLSFVKMQGCGNDYIFLDCFKETPRSPEKLAVRLCDRHFGVGGDGLVLILPSETCDAEMRMFNRDGSEGLMCGNAIRCVGKYLYDVRGVGRERITVATRSGVRELRMLVKDGIAVGAEVCMGRALTEPQAVPVRLEGDPAVGRKVVLGGVKYKITCVSVGNPHCVIFCDSRELSRLDIIGPVFEHSPLFPQGVNTELVHVLDAHHLRMRVWERGSGETLACGTGACASVAAAVLNGFCGYEDEVLVQLDGGELKVRYMRDGELFMSGDAVTVFEGSMSVPYDIET